MPIIDSGKLFNSSYNINKHSVSKNKGFTFSSKDKLYSILKTNPLKSWILKHSLILKKYSFFSINFCLNKESKERLNIICKVNKKTSSC